MGCIFHSRKSSFSDQMRHIRHHQHFDVFRVSSRIRCSCFSKCKEFVNCSFVCFQKIIYFKNPKSIFSEFLIWHLFTGVREHAFFYKPSCSFCNCISKSFVKILLSTNPCSYFAELVPAKTIVVVVFQISLFVVSRYEESVDILGRQIGIKYIPCVASIHIFQPSDYWIEFRKGALIQKLRLERHKIFPEHLMGRR